MKIRALLFICCTTILVSAVEAKIKEDEGAPKQIVHIEKMDKRVSELMVSGQRMLGEYYFLPSKC